MYGVIFYSNSFIYSYSINGQFLHQIDEPTGFIYSMGVVDGSDKMENLVYLNRNREVMIEELPELRRKKRIRLKKDEFKISCFESSEKMALVGIQDGTIQIIADPTIF